MVKKILTEEQRVELNASLRAALRVIYQKSQGLDNPENRRQIQMLSSIAENLVLALQGHAYAIQALGNEIDLLTECLEEIEYARPKVSKASSFIDRARQAWATLVANPA